MVELDEKTRIIQEFVPGKQVTLAHVIASPVTQLYEKLGLIDGEGAIGIFTITPSEAAMIAADVASKAADVSIALSIVLTARWSLPAMSRRSRHHCTTLCPSCAIRWALLRHRLPRPEAIMEEKKNHSDRPLGSRKNHPVPVFEPSGLTLSQDADRADCQSVHDGHAGRVSRTALYARRTDGDFGGCRTHRAGAGRNRKRYDVPAGVQQHVCKAHGRNCDQERYCNTRTD